MSVAVYGHIDERKDLARMCSLGQSQVKIGRFV